MQRRVCVIVGVGPGNGAAFARRFASEGYTVALLARTLGFSRSLAAELDQAQAYACDVTDLSSVARVFETVQRELGEVDVLVYNAGSGSWGHVEEITPAQLEQALRVNTVGLLTCAQAVIPSMKRRASGSIVVIGATASRRGGALAAAFAPAKAAQRSLSESMGRHLWPVGIHVSLIVIDGVVDLPSTRERMGDRPDSFFVKPDEVAETALWLVRQPRSAWTFELEARPFGETW
jgi:NAD(P)-dependent dehydrogenase (short-subunit alcohol dehydrogenase family)